MRLIWLIKMVPDEFSLVPTGMIYLREARAMAALKTLSEGVTASASRKR